MLAGYALLALTIAATVPPLADPAERQLASARDFTARLDGPALYPLLENALRWPDGAEAGARVPDFPRLHRDPGAARGELFLLEGKLARVDEPGRMSRPGPWSAEIERWIVQLQPPPDEVVGVVFLVSPPDKPLYGTKIRTVGRFYKIWRAEDMQNETRDFPVFVGHGASIEQRAVSRPGGAQSQAMAALLLALVVGLALTVWWLQRRVGRQRATRRRWQLGRESGERDSGDHDAEADDSNEPPLPRDPAEALGELASRHQENAADERSS